MIMQTHECIGSRCQRVSRSAEILCFLREAPGVVSAGYRPGLRCFRRGRQLLARAANSHGWSRDVAGTAHSGRASKAYFGLQAIDVGISLARARGVPPPWSGRDCARIARVIKWELGVC